MAENAARDLAQRPRGTVRLAVPMAFGLRAISPLLPAYFRIYPENKIDLHLSDAQVDLVGEGFDAALRIAVLEESSLVVRQLRPVERWIVASPAYIARYGRPQHPSDLAAHRCLGYAYRARQDVWRFTGRQGEEFVEAPSGPLRVTNSDALLPTVLDGIGIAELPDFIASEYVTDGRLVTVIPEWRLASGGLYFVTPTARNRPAKVEALAQFFAENLTKPRFGSG